MAIDKKPEQEMDLQTNRPVPRKIDLSELAARERAHDEQLEAGRNGGNEVVEDPNPPGLPERNPSAKQYEWARELKGAVDGVLVQLNAAESVLPRDGRRAREFALARTYLEDAGMRIQRGILMKV